MQDVGKFMVSGYAVVTTGALNMRYWSLSFWSSFPVLLFPALVCFDLFSVSRNTWFEGFAEISFFFTFQ